MLQKSMTMGVLEGMRIRTRTSNRHFRVSSESQLSWPAAFRSLEVLRGQGFSITKHKMAFAEGECGAYHDVRHSKYQAATNEHHHHHGVLEHAEKVKSLVVGVEIELVDSPEMDGVW